MNQQYKQEYLYQLAMLPKGERSHLDFDTFVAWRTKQAIKQFN